MIGEFASRLPVAGRSGAVRERSKTYSTPAALISVVHPERTANGFRYRAADARTLLETR